MRQIRYQHVLMKAVAGSSLIFPLLLLITFALHLHSFSDLFATTFKQPAYNANLLFDELIHNGGAGFIHAHAMAYLSVPFMLITLLYMSYLVLQQHPLLSVIGTGIGLIGMLALSGFFATWLSFSAISKIEPEYYVGAKAALIELTRMAGFLKIITWFSLLAFIGMMVLSIGLLAEKKLPKWSPICVFTGCFLLVIFTGLIHWMFMGSLLILVGMIPISRLYTVFPFTKNYADKH